MKDLQATISAAQSEAAQARDRARELEAGLFAMEQRAADAERAFFALQGDLQKANGELEALQSDVYNKELLIANQVQDRVYPSTLAPPSGT